ALEGGRQIGGGRQASRVVEACKDPPTQPSDQLQAIGRGVDQHQLLDRQDVSQPAEAVHQLRGVRRAAADHGDLQSRLAHPLTPVNVTPWMNAFCAMKNTTITGAMTSTVAAMVRFQSVWWALLKVCRP